MTSPEKPTLCLHVGYGKTGSTAIQYWLASQQQALEAAGVAYPIPETGIGDSGNGFLLLEALAQPHQRPWWLNQAQSNLRGWLFSREQFARELSEPGRCEQLAAWAERWGFGSVQILLFVRDPREHCYSLWAQKVKRAGERRSLHTFAFEYDSLVMASQFLSSALDAGLCTQVFNYGSIKSRLSSVFIGWLHEIVDPVSSHVSISGLPRVLSSENLTPMLSQVYLLRHLNKIWLFGRPPIPPLWLSRCLMRVAGADLDFDYKLIALWRSQVLRFNLICQENQVKACLGKPHCLPAPGPVIPGWD